MEGELLQVKVITGNWFQIEWEKTKRGNTFW
jgi:hypothetical protein